MTKKILFHILLIVLVMISIEIVSSSFSLFLMGKIRFHSEYDRRKTQIIETSNNQPGQPASHSKEETIGKIQIIYHPYLGYVRDPDTFTNYEGIHYHNLFDFPNIVPQKQEDRIVLLITGGSVAGGLSTEGLPYLLDQLAHYPYFKNKHFEVYHAAYGGYKQPQQLLSLNLILAMGGQFDMVVNLDGFNEMVLPVADNVPNRVNPFYPRRWDLLMDQIADPEYVSAIGQKAFLEQRRQRWASFFTGNPGGWSATLNLVWFLGDHYIARQIQQCVFHLETSKTEKTSIAAQGPSYKKESEEEIYRDMADFWWRCSIQMHRICRENNIHYFHFLQPNQYVSDSKPFTREENEHFRNNPRYKKSASEGYPYLIQAGETLRDYGVHFDDLTLLFERIDQTVYSDDCCHFNSLGQEMIARRIGETIGTQLSSNQTDPESAASREILSPTAAIKPFHSDSRANKSSSLIIAQGFGGRSVVKICPPFSPNSTDSVLLSSLGKSLDSKLEQPSETQRSTYISTGDIDQDGDMDIVISHGPIIQPATYPNLITVHDAKTFKLIGHPFSAFNSGMGNPANYNQGDIRTAVGHFLSPDRVQIAVAQGWNGNGLIRLYQYTGRLAPNGFETVCQFDGSNKKENEKGELNLATGDLDGDGLDELVVSQTSDVPSTISFQVIQFDSMGKITERRTFGLPNDLRSRGAVFAIADLNGDGQKELIAAAQGVDHNASSPINWISVFQPVKQNNALSRFDPIGKIPFSAFSAAENPSGVIHIACGNLDNDLTNGEEIVGGTGSSFEIDKFTIKPLNPAPQPLYRILKCRIDGNRVEWITLPEINSFYQAFPGEFKSTSGAIHLAVGIID